MASGSKDSAAAVGTTTPGDEEEEAVSTATTAATTDPEKQAAIREEKAKIEAAQARIQSLTGGRRSRAGSDFVNVGSTHSQVSRTIHEKVDVTTIPTVCFDPLTGSCRQFASPAQIPKLPGAKGLTTGETTDTASPSGSGSGGSKQSRGGLARVQLLTPANDNEVIAVQCIAIDDHGRRIRLRAKVGDDQPTIGEIVSVANMYGPGIDFRGQVIEVSEPLIVDKSRITGLARTEASKMRRAERAKAEERRREEEMERAKAYEAMTTRAGLDPTDDDIVLDVEAPPNPVQEETEADLVIDISDDCKGVS